MRRIGKAIKATLIFIVINLLLFCHGVYAGDAMLRIPSSFQNGSFDERADSVYVEVKDQLDESEELAEDEINNALESDWEYDYFISEGDNWRPGYDNENTIMDDDVLIGEGLYLSSKYPKTSISQLLESIVENQDNI